MNRAALGALVVLVAALSACSPDLSVSRSQADVSEPVSAGEQARLTPAEAELLIASSREQSKLTRTRAAEYFAAAAASTKSDSSPSDAAPRVPEAAEGPRAAPGGGSAAKAPAADVQGAPAPPPVAPAPAPPAPAPAPACPSNVGGSTPGAPSRTSAQSVAGTTSGDLADFAAKYNAIRVANCLAPIPLANIRYDSCMEDRLFWMAEDPSSDPASAWGHKGQVSRSDGVPDTGCDGNLAGGSGMTGAGAAQRWWDSSGHRASLYKPGASTAGVCILFSMTHGGVPNEPYSFTRAAARWVNC